MAPQRMPFRYRINEPFITTEAATYLQEVVNDGWLSIRGPHTTEFERLFAEMVGVSHALAVCSGTAALHTALLALGVEKGDVVVIPNFTCGACATSVLFAGGVPRIVDVEPDTFGMDAKQLRAALEPGDVKAVMLVHCYGFPAKDTFEIQALCNEYGVKLLEDGSEAHGAVIGGSKIGSIGDIACFSCRSDKMVGVGEAGMIVSNNSELMERAAYFASRAAPFRKPEDDYWQAYHYTGVGHNYLLPHLSGAVGHAQMMHFDEIVGRKRTVGETYQKVLKENGYRTQQRKETAEPVYWLNIVLLDHLTVNQVRKVGTELMERGIEIRPAF
ncbi:MAG: aminotransferase class I/II-fold pyridoxal phosphate-dependent enzyme [Bdellovibrionales bacterium]|nr:aminotransferase class I/II-fold pyridoxal phosphate-dependent enzyme [Bdellovibrionales bacterium]